MATTLKDFDKTVTDLLNDDFDSKFTLKIKTVGPYKSVFTTLTSYDVKTGKLVPKLTLKCGHSSGFALDKLEFSSDAKVAVECAMDMKEFAPGLKAEFKGNDSDKADVSLQYTVPKVAVVTADFDMNNFSNVKASVNGVHGDFTFGAGAEVKIAKSTVESTTVNVGAGYTIPKQAFFGVRANKNFAEFSALCRYFLNNDLTVAGVANHTAKGPNATLVAQYKCNPLTTLKLKANTCGVLSASVKQLIEKNLVVVGSAEVPSDFNAVKFGVNAILG
jgi:hypothetical protein